MRLSDLDEVIARLDESSFHSNPTLAAECVDAALARLREWRENAVEGQANGPVSDFYAFTPHAWSAPDHWRPALLITTPREER